MLSSFESEGKADANGESRYLEIHINKVDEQLIQQYIMQARGILEEKMERMIVEVEDSITSTVIVQVPDDTPYFEYDAFVSGSSLANYTVNESALSTAPSAYTIQFLSGDGLMKFAICVSGTKTTAYTNLESMTFLGTSRYNYIEDNSTKKIYRLKGTEQEKIWASYANGGALGQGLIDFTRSTISKPTTVVEEGFIWTINNNSRWNGIKTFTKHINEAIVAYVMAAWLKGKLDDRVPFYEGLFNNTLALAVKNIFTKQAP